MIRQPALTGMDRVAIVHKVIPGNCGSVWSIRCIWSKPNDETDRIDEIDQIDAIDIF